jgi:GrpB-like predicted nucleotidyltransferase (UPF0157 family)
LLIDVLHGLGAEIEHVGSTAVPGLRAKPILDIAVGIPDIAEVGECKARLQQVGYEYRGDAGEEGGHVFLRAMGDVRTHHVHVVALDGPAWLAYLRLRELLRTNPVALEMYSAGKEELAVRFANDRKAYTKAKAPLVDRVLSPSDGTVNRRSRYA